MARSGNRVDSLKFINRGIRRLDIEGPARWPPRETVKSQRTGSAETLCQMPMPTHRGERLRSPLRDAGKADNCPACRNRFVIPGSEFLKQVSEAQRAASDRTARAKAGAERRDGLSKNASGSLRKPNWFKSSQRQQSRRMRTLMQQQMTVCTSRTQSSKQLRRSLRP